MSDPTETVTATTKPTFQPPQKSILARAGDAVAGALHAAGNFADRIGEDVAEGAEAVAPLAKEAAALAWKNAAAGLDAIVTRNEAEWTTNVEKGVATYLLSLAPGAAPVASIIAGIAVDATKGLIDFAKGKLEQQAATPLAPIGPPLTPTPPTT